MRRCCISNWRKELRTAGTDVASTTPTPAHHPGGDDGTTTKFVGETFFREPSVYAGLLFVNTARRKRRASTRERPIGRRRNGVEMKEKEAVRRVVSIFVRKRFSAPLSKETLKVHIPHRYAERRIVRDPGA